MVLTGNQQRFWGNFQIPTPVDLSFDMWWPSYGAQITCQERMRIWFYSNGVIQPTLFFGIFSGTSSNCRDTRPFLHKYGTISNPDWLAIHRAGGDTWYNVTIKTDPLDPTNTKYHMINVYKDDHTYVWDDEEASPLVNSWQFGFQNGDLNTHNYAYNFNIRNIYVKGVKVVLDPVNGLDMVNEWEAVAWDSAVPHVLPTVTSAGGFGGQMNWTIYNRLELRCRKVATWEEI